MAQLDSFSPLTLNVLLSGVCQCGQRNGLGLKSQLCCLSSYWLPTFRVRFVDTSKTALGTCEFTFVLGLSTCCFRAALLCSHPPYGATIGLLRGSLSRIGRCDPVSVFSGGNFWMIFVFFLFFITASLRCSHILSHLWDALPFNNEMALQFIQSCAPVDGRDPVLLADTCKELQISKSISV